MEQLRILGEVALAMLLGGAIGFEREVARKPAGFRTHMLVSGAAALLVGLSFTLVDRFAHRTAAADVLGADPIRVVQAIIVGVSFLAGGTIFRSEKGEVEGLTTAASLLMVSGIGAAVGLGQIVLAAGATALVYLVLKILARLESRFHQSDS